MNPTHTISLVLQHLWAVMKELLVCPSKLQSRKVDYLLYNPIKSVESYIKMFTSYDSLLTKKYLAGIILKETKILKCNEAIVNLKKSLKIVRLRIRNSVRRETISMRMQSFLLRTFLYLKFVPSQPLSFGRIVSQTVM